MLPAEHTHVDVCVRRMDETLVVDKTRGRMNVHAGGAEKQQGDALEGQK